MTSARSDAATSVRSVASERGRSDAADSAENQAGLAGGCRARAARRVLHVLLLGMSLAMRSARRGASVAGKCGYKYRIVRAAQRRNAARRAEQWHGSWRTAQHLSERGLLVLRIFILAG